MFRSINMNCVVQGVLLVVELCTVFFFINVAMLLFWLYKQNVSSAVFDATGIWVFWFGVPFVAFAPAAFIHVQLTGKSWWSST